MQTRRLLISPAMEVRARRLPQCLFPGKAGELYRGEKTTDAKEGGDVRQ